MLTVVTVALLLVFGAIQAASDALEADAAAPGTLPHRIPASFGLSVYRVLDRVAPAPYVETALARNALATGDLDGAQRYALRLSASPVRDELLAQVAAARGSDGLAAEYDLAAPDPSAVAAIAARRALRDPAAGYALESELRARLIAGATHPDAVAQADSAMGRLANQQAWREISGSPAQNAWLRRAGRDLDRAVALAPLSERYIVEAANQADLLGDRARARALFERAVASDPSSADALAGLGVVAWQNGDRAGAVALLTRARALDPSSLMVRALERDLAAAR